MSEILFIFSTIKCKRIPLIKPKKNPKLLRRTTGGGKVRTTTNKSLSVQKLHLQNNPGRVSNGTIHLHYSGKRRESSERIVGSRSSEIFADNATEA